MSKNVLFIGLTTQYVDFSQWPELTPEKLENSYVAHIAFNTNPENTVAAVQRWLS